MHRHPIVTVAHLSGSRLLATAATQLKPRSQLTSASAQSAYESKWKPNVPPHLDPTTSRNAKPSSRSTPHAKNWARGSQPATSSSSSSQRSQQQPPRISDVQPNQKNLGKWAKPASSPAQKSSQSEDTLAKPAQLETIVQKPAKPASESAKASSNDDTPTSFLSTVVSDDPRRQGSRRPPASNLRLGVVDQPNYRRKDPLNKPLVKKTMKPRPKTRTIRRKNVYIPSTLTVAMLSKLLNVKLDRLIGKMRRVGMEAEANYDYILSADYAVLLAEEFGFNPIVDDEAAFDIHPPSPHANQSNIPSRPPIVTIMGHVDHGKTTLLDTLRSASVAKGEAGGITQHIGAFSVPVSSEGSDAGGPQSITFLDTPGHAAFSAMRARGANVTDIVVLVVAADDGIMPQTKEVINLLNKDGSQVDLVVAINKIDKPGADTDSVKKALMAEGVQLEEFGGDIPAVHVSGLTGEGLPDLIATLSAVAEVRDLRADQDGPVYGHVLESNVHKGLGSVATVLIRQGSLKIGSHIICGTTQAKVRRMTDSSGNTIQSASPGMAVTICGWKTLPKAGDEVLEGSEADIKKAIVNRVRKAEAEALQEDAEAINEARRLERDTRAEGLDTPVVVAAPTGPKELRLVIKADVSGSCEALEGALQGIGNHIAVSKVVSTGVGPITESDVMMAKAANATIIGFSVAAPRPIQALAAQNNVPVSIGDVIYRIMDDVRSRVVDMLPKIVETKVVGEATVLQLFDITTKAKQILKVAGCRVTNGILEKNKFARVVRSGEVVHDGTLDTMRQVKKDITEARKGLECGLSLKDFSDLREGDMIQMYEKIEKPGVI